ncbi:hypothetical protein HDU93_007351 [Gonapodya sp. JEL0774]|nr:hypothetical protein HDU93_007351 [Gonapodya sp. JEL0774]
MGAGGALSAKSEAMRAALAASKLGNYVKTKGPGRLSLKGWTTDRILTDKDCIVPPEQRALLDTLPGWEEDTMRKKKRRARESNVSQRVGGPVAHHNSSSGQGAPLMSDQNVDEFPDFNDEDLSRIARIEAEVHALLLRPDTDVVSGAAVGVTPLEDPQLVAPDREGVDMIDYEDFLRMQESKPAQEEKWNNETIDVLLTQVPILGSTGASGVDEDECSTSIREIDYGGLLTQPPRERSIGGTNSDAEIENGQDILVCSKGDIADAKGAAQPGTQPSESGPNVLTQDDNVIGTVNSPFNEKGSMDLFPSDDPPPTACQRQRTPTPSPSRSSGMSGSDPSRELGHSSEQSSLPSVLPFSLLALSGILPRSPLRGTAPRARDNTSIGLQSEPPLQRSPWSSSSKMTFRVGWDWGTGAVSQSDASGECLLPKESPRAWGAGVEWGNIRTQEHYSPGRMQGDVRGLSQDAHSLEIEKAGDSTGESPHRIEPHTQQPFIKYAKHEEEMKLPAEDSPEGDGIIERTAPQEEEFNQKPRWGIQEGETRSTIVMQPASKITRNGSDDCAAQFGTNSDVQEEPADHGRRLESLHSQKVPEVVLDLGLPDSGIDAFTQNTGVATESTSKRSINILTAIAGSTDRDDTSSLSEKAAAIHDVLHYTLDAAATRSNEIVPDSQGLIESGRIGGDILISSCQEPSFETVNESPLEPVTTSPVMGDLMSSAVHRADIEPEAVDFTETSQSVHCVAKSIVNSSVTPDSIEVYSLANGDGVGSSTHTVDITKALADADSSSHASTEVESSTVLPSPCRLSGRGKRRSLEVPIPSEPLSISNGGRSCKRTPRSHHLRGNRTRVQAGLQGLFVRGLSPDSDHKDWEESTRCTSWPESNLTLSMRPDLELALSVQDNPSQKETNKTVEALEVSFHDKRRFDQRERQEGLSPLGADASIVRDVGSEGEESDSGSLVGTLYQMGGLQGIPLVGCENTPVDPAQLTLHFRPRVREDEPEDDSRVQNDWQRGNALQNVDLETRSQQLVADSPPDTNIECGQKVVRSFIGSSPGDRSFIPQIDLDSDFHEIEDDRREQPAILQIGITNTEHTDQNQLIYPTMSSGVMRRVDPARMPEMIVDIPLFRGKYVSRAEHATRANNAMSRNASGTRTEA